MTLIQEIPKKICIIELRFYDILRRYNWSIWEIYVMRPELHVKWLRLHYKRMLITGLSQQTLEILLEF